MLSEVKQKIRTAKSSRNRLAIYIPALRKREAGTASFHFEVKEQNNAVSCTLAVKSTPDEGTA